MSSSEEGKWSLAHEGNFLDLYLFSFQYYLLGVWKSIPLPSPEHKRGGQFLPGWLILKNIAREPCLTLWHFCLGALRDHLVPHALLNITINLLSQVTWKFILRQLSICCIWSFKGNSQHLKLGQKAKWRVMQINLQLCSTLCKASLAKSQAITCSSYWSQWVGCSGDQRL